MNLLDSFGQRITGKKTESGKKLAGERREWESVVMSQSVFA